MILSRNVALRLWCIRLLSNKEKSKVLKFYDMKHVETALNPSNIRFPESFRKTKILKLYVKAFC